MRQKHRLLLVLAVVAILGAIWSYVLMSSPPQQTLDQRVHNVSVQLKCMICQGESVADSQSLFAENARTVIRQKLQEGKSEEDVIQYFRSRYGDQIILEPQWQGYQVLAWLVPIAMLLTGCLLLFFVLRSWKAAIITPAATKSEQTPLNTTEMERYRRQLEQELADDDPTLFKPQIREAH